MDASSLALDYLAMAKELSNISTKLSNVQTVVITTGAIITALWGGFTWFKTEVVNSSAHAIEQALTEQFAGNLVTLNRYKSDRRADSLERKAAVDLALEYMDRQDSMAHVITGIHTLLAQVHREVKYVRAKQTADTAATRDRQLEAIWKFLQDRDQRDSTQQHLSTIMREIRTANRAKVQQVQKGDRAQ
jgi:hypothetical protein